MEVVAAIGWIIGLAALAAVGWGQQKLAQARGLLEEKRADIGTYKQQLTDMVRESNASLTRVKERASTEKRFAHEPVVKDVLEVVDSFERALETLPEGREADGVRMIHKQLVGVLARHGVERVGAVGEAFDPEVHEAIGTQPSDEHDVDTVLQEWCGGYRLHGRVLRAAKVVLAAPPATVDEITEDVPLDVEPDQALTPIDEAPVHFDDARPAGPKGSEE